MSKHEICVDCNAVIINSTPCKCGDKYVMPLSEFLLQHKEYVTKFVNNKSDGDIKLKFGGDIYVHIFVKYEFNGIYSSHMRVSCIIDGNEMSINHLFTFLKPDAIARRIDNLFGMIEQDIMHVHRMETGYDMTE